MEVENGTFTPLVFGTNGGVGSEGSMFLATLADKLSVVRGEDVNVTMEWLRTKLSFEVLRSALLCVRGSKKAWYKKDEVLVKISQDFGLSVVVALRCRARAGFSRRSRENPVAWALGHWMARDKNSCP